MEIYLYHSGYMYIVPSKCIIRQNRPTVKTFDLKVLENIVKRRVVTQIHPWAFIFVVGQNIENGNK